MSAKICFFDIETSNLNANYGYMLCGAWKVLGEKKVNIAKISDSPGFEKDKTNDKYIANELRKALSEMDILVGWYSSKFDLPYINSRLLYHKLPVIAPNTPHIDCWRLARYKMRLNSNRLQSVTEFLGEKDKTPLNGPIWIKAMAGDKKSLSYVVEHCKVDVEVLERAYMRMRPLMTDHPNVNIVSGKTDSCPVCGVAELQSRGYTIARVNRTPRFQCQGCGAWSRGRTERIKQIQIR